MKPREVTRGARHRSQSRCPLCDYDLWVAPGSPITTDEVLRIHLINRHGGETHENTSPQDSGSHKNQ